MMADCNNGNFFISRPIINTIGKASYRKHSNITTFFAGGKRKFRYPFITAANLGQQSAPQTHTFSFVVLYGNSQFLVGLREDAKFSLKFLPNLPM